MNANLELYQDMVRRFVGAEVDPHQQRWREQQHVDRELWRKAGELGLLLSDIPDEYGGAGGDYAHMAILFEELAAVGDRAFGVHVHAIVAHYLLNQGTEEQKRRYLPRLASGEMIAAIAMTEPGAGSDLQGVRTRAVKDGDGYLINGSKIFISNGYLADLVVVVARTDPDAGAKGLSLLLVETRDRPGYRVGRILDKLGQKGQDTCELFFDDVRVSADAVLGGVEGRGFAQLMSELPYERVLLAVSALGAIERALRLRSRRASRGLAPRVLAQELKQKGIAPELIDAELGEISHEDDRELAERLVTKRLASTAGLDPEARTLFGSPECSSARDSAQVWPLSL